MKDDVMELENTNKATHCLISSNSINCKVLQETGSLSHNNAKEGLVVSPPRTPTPL